jgi:hypothetical protein
VADTRICEQCGTVFVPRREHARFCSARCRVAWNREKLGNPAAEVNALQWSVTAMSDATGRIPRLGASDPRGLTVIGDAVWWVTIVDATLVRHHPDAYDGVMVGQIRAERSLIEGVLAGLRFVRNRIGLDVDLADLVDPGASRGGPGDGHITAWTWTSVPEPDLSSLSPRGQAWERTRYHAYQNHLAGYSIGETFGRAAAFLKLTAAKAALDSETSAHAVG